jgi:hypothetical protein
LVSEEAEFIGAIRNTDVPWQLSGELIKKILMIPMDTWSILVHSIARDAPVILAYGTNQLQFTKS